MFQHRRPVNKHEDGEEIANITNGVEVARLLPQSLLKPYLMARMKDTDNRPCLFSTFIGRSVDLILEHRAEYTNLERRQMFVDMVAAFNDDLIGSYCSDIFSTLFDSQSLNYWLRYVILPVLPSTRILSTTFVCFICSALLTEALNCKDVKQVQHNKT